MNKKGKLFILIGPTGVGKTTLINGLLEKQGNKEIAEFVVTYTTREPRPGERPGVDFNFLTVEEFEKRVREGFFLEWSKAYKNYYGSPRKKILDLVDAGKSAIITIDRHGAEQALEKVDGVVIIYILPLNQEKMWSRAKKRGTESNQRLRERLEQSMRDVEGEKINPIADYTIVNDDLNVALAEFDKILKKEIFLG